MRPRLEPIPRKWLKTAEAAEYANDRGYPEATVEMIRAHVALDLLPAFAIGRGFSYRLRVDDVDVWLKRKPWTRSHVCRYSGWRWTAEEIGFST